MAVMVSLIKALLQGSSTVLLLLSVSCGTEYDKGWSWGMVTEDGDMTTAKFLWDSHEVRVDDILLAPVNKHEKCKNKHYHDPYTKIEYCLPEDFNNINKLHLYRVQ
jgi:hypothetical protein